MEKRISGTTKVMALIGSPVGHSGSPAMYNYCFQKDGYDGAYVAFEVTLDTLKDAMTGIKALNLQGINITMPCKSAVIEYLDEISPAAKLIGACNVAVNKGGRWQGHNTDGIGFVENLKAHGVDVTGKNLCVIGAGGAGTAIIVQCALSGAKSISVFNLKDPFFERAEHMAQNVSSQIPSCAVAVYDLADEKTLLEKIAESDILVNASRAGMHPNDDETPIKNTAAFRSGLVVCDTVYNPRETRFLKEAEAAGSTPVPGVGMLVYQGAAALKLFTGAEMPVEEIQEKFF
ncbi:MAG: shikimate dehydrogenase [Oscillospiraceae bacterium]